MIQDFLNRAFIPALRGLVWVFFRKIGVVNADKIPDDVPLIFTPNHTNSLIDGMLALSYLPGRPRALAKSTLWNNPVTRSLMIAANTIPVYRQQDAKSPGQMGDNSKMFEACAQALAQNNHIALFPEGTSHDEPELLPLKTGAARIALSAEQQHGPLSVRIVPVGLIFDDKKKFRSRVLIYFGDPIPAVLEQQQADPENRDQVNALTDRIEAGIKSVTLNYPSWEEANLIQRAASLYQSLDHGGDEEEADMEGFSLHKQMADAYPAMQESYPKTVQRVIKAVNSYDRLLRVLSIQHDHFVQDRPGILRTLTNLPRLSMFLIRLPLAVVGILLNFIPYFLTGLISLVRMPVHRKSTAKVFGGLVLYPLCWSLQAGFLAEGLMPAWFWWLLAPASGVTSLLFREQHAQLLEELITYLRVQTQTELREELEERLETVEREVAEFIAVAKRLEPGAGSPESPTVQRAVQAGL